VWTILKILKDIPSNSKFTVVKAYRIFQDLKDCGDGIGYSELLRFWTVPIFRTPVILKIFQLSTSVQ
jgi:hypothetical protein